MLNVTGAPAIDLAIGLSFIFLLLSLLASAVQEAIAGIFALRASMLERGLRNMLAPKQLPTDKKRLRGGRQGQAAMPPAEGSAEDLVGLMYAHPRIRSLYKEGVWGRSARLPSYISPRSFGLALIDTLAPDALAPAPGGQVPDSHDVVGAVRGAIAEAGLPDDVKRQLLLLVDQARGDLDELRQGVEAWFDDSMARVSGWYKRQTQLILCVVGVIVTLLLNANALTVGERLWKDPTVRAALVERAVSPDVTGQATGDTPHSRLNSAASDVDRVANLGVPLGWSANSNDPRHVRLHTPGEWLRVLGGWLLTIAAILMGAPFWFDTLGRLSRLRNSGKPEPPLPATGRGQPNERVVAQVPTVNVALQGPPQLPGGVEPPRGRA